MMFWSKTKVVVHGFTAKRKDCFVTLEDTLLGSVLDGLTWCGKEGSNDTFTNGCPGWSDCENNPVRSFWIRASAFADVTCDNVTAMLNELVSDPFNSTSIFASVEVPRLNASRVKNLNVVMVIQKNNISNCTDPSLKNLTQTLDTGITFSCKDVPESWIQECGSKPEIACGACW
ncbi:ADP-ribosyl cyclase/cyclic ADP-ribose hydrolase 1-like [Pelmatolapia mariae]|uniref:ADP-ribosyl cyclase/cyclic ADP-ribose hydrolase 1-like n=1 Tax=Pelmatolapia mariae TaxID=158779 RepID=UPI002FE5BAEC